MSAISQTNMFSNMQTNGYNPFTTTPAPTWNNWTDNAVNPMNFQPQEFKFSQWQDTPSRSGYGGVDPSFKRLSEGNYRDFETALRTPGEIAAKKALNQGQINLNDTMNAGGMYGSSIMSNQANDKLYGNYLDTMANNSANAVGQRYGMEQRDNQFAGDFDRNVWNTKVGEWNNLNQMNLQENLAKNSAIFNQNQNYNSYNMNKANWGLNAANQSNTLLAQPYEDQWRRATFNSSQDDRLWNRYNNFWSNADPLKDEEQVNRTASMAKQREGGSDGALGALGGIGGSLLGGVVGSVVPGVGTALGASLGGMLGGTGSKFLSSGNNNMPGASYIDTPGTTMTGGSFRAMS